MTMLVLLPSVAATNASARSIPAAWRASISRAVPTVNCPPASSHASSIPTSSRACASGSSSRHETSWPSRSIARASEEPTRPTPTIRMNIGGMLLGGRGWTLAVSTLAGGRLNRLRRGGEQDPAGRLSQHVFRHLSNLGRPRATPAAQHRAAPDLRRWLPAHDDQLDAATARLLDDSGPHGPR